MKKLIVALSMFLAFAGYTSAQTAPAKTETKTTTVKTEKKMKKDGTPDKRYKENKSSTAESVHLKKDGTVDKRYKENKSTTTTTTR